MIHPHLIRSWWLVALSALGCASPDLPAAKPIVQAPLPPSASAAALPFPNASAPASAAVPPEGAPSPAASVQHLPPPSPSAICQVRWSLDGATVAAVDAQHLRLRPRDAQSWAVELDAPPGRRFIDVSIPGQAILEEEADGRRKLVSLHDGHSLFPEVLAKAPWARLTEDGTKLLAVERSPDGGLEVPWFVDLRTAKKQEIWIPSVSAAPDDPTIVSHRRNVLEIRKARVAAAFLDIRHALDPHEAIVITFYGGWEEGEGSYGWGISDIDNDFNTIAVMKRDWYDDAPEKDRAKVEVYRHVIKTDVFDRAKLIAKWPIDPHAFRALWLSPEGSRLVLRTEQHGKLTHTVWNTATGKRLGVLPLRGECFDFAPDGKRVADKRGDDLAILTLP